MKCNTLEDMNNQIAYRQVDDPYVVKAGIQGNVDSIIDLLKQKCIDDVRTKNVSASTARFCSRVTCSLSTGGLNTVRLTGYVHNGEYHDQLVN